MSSKKKEFIAWFESQDDPDPDLFIEYAMAKKGRVDLEDILGAVNARTRRDKQDETG